MKRERIETTSLRRRLRTCVAGAVFLGPLLSNGVVHAQDESLSGPPTTGAPAPSTTKTEVLGTVLGTDQDDIVLDLGAGKGATISAVVELWRPFKLRHPVTGQTLTDRFRIGSLRLTQVQKTLTLARPEGTLARIPAAGDVVILTRIAQTAAPRTSSPREPVAPSDSSKGDTRLNTPEGAAAKPSEGEAREIGALIDGLRGRAIGERIVRYVQYVEAHPQGAYNRVLVEDAAAFRRLLVDVSQRTQQTPENTGVLFAPPTGALAGEALTLGVETRAVAAAVLHVRHAGEVAYQSQPMQSAGRDYFRATVARERMQAPEVEYFIESVDEHGVAAALVGTADHPLRLEVHAAPRARPEAHPEASAAIFTDFADYNRLRGNDYAWQTEGHFGLRYDDKGVRAVRSGFGVFRGVGGAVKELDTLGQKPRKVGLTYGYLEGEFGASRSIAVIARLALGLTDDGVNGGGQFFLRLGNDKVTNLLLGGEVLGGVGTKGIAELQWNTLPRVPIVIRTEVTNQPAGTKGRSTGILAPGETPTISEAAGDIGARAMLQVGYRVVPELTIALRASYEGRTIQHAGPGAGAGVSYSW